MAGGERKYGRNDNKCAKYRRENRHKRNRLSKLRRHLKDHPNDAVAAEAVGRVERIRERPVDQ